MRFQIILSWILLLPFCSIVFNLDMFLVYSQCLRDQKSLLLRMKNSLIYDNTISTKLMTWNSSLDCCSWGGVNCEKTRGGRGRVIGLDLSNEYISGGLNDSSSLFDLKFLFSLNLAYNNFDDVEMLSGFGKLVHLTYLNLSNAGFSGQVPIGISYLSKLLVLDMSISSFLANLPLKLENPNLETLIGNMSGLEELYLGGVNLSVNGYEWCKAVSSSLPKLRVLGLGNCGLSGPIDSSLAKLRELSVIRLDNNNLSTPVPDFFSGFKNLTVLSLSTSGLIGTFPAKIFQVPTLQIIDLSNNVLLQGWLPPFSPQDSSLKTLKVGTTSFSGKLPDSVGNLKNLSWVDLASCHFEGLIPISMENLTQLVYLDFSSNDFTGPVPSFRSSRNLTRIVFSHNNLTGAVPSSNYESLQNLVILDFRNNSLNGMIPLSLFSLPSLEKIQLSDNEFNGIFDEFSIGSSSRGRLDTLDLSSNKLKGKIPNSVFELIGLNVLLLSHNNFNGTVDLDKIQNLKNLTAFDLSFNNLSIHMSSENSALSSLPQLTALKLASCNLTVFPLLTNQSKLSVLDLSINRIHGVIPSWVWTIGQGSIRQLNLSYNRLVGFENPLNSSRNLSILDLHNNLLQGQIPILTSSATFLDYSNNNFSSFIPDEIGYNMNFTYFFSVSSNNLSGTIPRSMCNAAYLHVLDMSSNKLNGEIPSCLFQLVDLGVLNLHGNQISGFVPDTFTSKCLLQTLDLNDNQLSGRVPRTLANCTALEVFNIGNNKMNDSFPCWLKNSSSLRVLVMRSNTFHGSISCPGIISNLEKLQIVDLAFNNFSGELPPQCFKSWTAMMADFDKLQSVADHLQFKYLTQNYYQDAVTITFKGLQLELVKILTVFTSIDFSNNYFDGIIPDVIGELKSLYVLNLSYNAFAGQIPNSLSNLSQLGSLDLSQNKLTGSIPAGLINLNFLSFLNLSYNKLAGMIPRGKQFNTFTNSSYLGNPELCGVPLLRCADSTSNVTVDSSAGTEFNWQFIFTGIGFGVGAGMIYGSLLVSKSGRRWYNEKLDCIVSKILTFFGLVYSTYDFHNEWDDDNDDQTEDTTAATELTKFTGRSSDENEIKDAEKETLGRRYCVFCSKLDINMKYAIHNHNCTCPNLLHVSSSNSLSSNSST